MTIFTTKINLNNDKTYQLTGDTLNLSGNTFIKNLKYLEDNSVNYDDRSVIDKGYLDFRLDNFTGSSSVLVTGATNGTTLLNENIELGGTLYKNTDIDIDGNLFRLGEVSGFGGYFYINSSLIELSNYYSGVNNSKILMYFTGDTKSTLKLQSTTSGTTAGYIINQNGLQALDNYYSDNTNNNRWIPDKEYVDNQITGYTGNTIITGGTNGLTFLNKNVELGGTLYKNTDIIGNFKLNITGNTILNLQSGIQISGITFFDTTRNSTSNVRIGENSLLNNTTGLGNIGIGTSSQLSNILGCYNIGIGYESLRLGVNSCYNIGIGYRTNVNNGSDNIGIGRCSLCCTSSGSLNIGIGFQANRGISSSGTNNIGIGSNTNFIISSGSYNIGIGCRSLCCVTTGNNNIGIGNTVLSKVGTGNNNIGIGFNTLLNNTVNNNIGIGYYSLSANTTGINNIGIGEATLISNLSGLNNIGIGQNAGCGSLGSNNIFIGKNAGVSETSSGKLYIGSGNTSLIMGDITQDIVTLPKLKLRTTPSQSTGSDLLLTWNFTDKYVNAISSSIYNNNNYSLTGITTGITNITLTTGSSYVILINHVTGFTATLPLQPHNGEAFKFKDISGNAFTYNITINGNGKNIDGLSSTLINTNYGAIEIVYYANTDSWYSLGFVN